ncbi:phosphoesterase [Haloprofundus marisrubri]|uniref:Phosphoesterase n=1 Tax=Haloprofundus marisrubri TaxID=1514971 RepID=A0A0W1R8K2_9EURY|nr:metallophosphoesterase [Haloprofundus marisrubri]KTG09734.1 phosphoesterase [Haloprofundus marisrubri]
MADVYYLVSDLHIGGDEQLQECEFKDEFIEFLRGLESTDEDAELIVLGDAFGLWEFTEVRGLEKFDLLVDHHPELFEQFRATGEVVDITFIPGNHDAELAGYADYVDRLAEYNVELERELYLVRDVGGRRIWIEHGMQRDANNRLPEFGNPHANPLGYFVNRHITSKAGQLSGRGKYNWLKDMQSLTPLEEIPYWILSNYYYREMSPFLRYAALPFLLLFNFSLVYLVGVVLESTVLGTNFFTSFEWLRGLGFAGDLLEFVIVVNLVITGLLTVIAVPLFFFFRDAKKTLERFGLLVPDEAVTEQDASYLDAAREVFEDHPEAVAFVYGHTHRPSLKHVDGRLVVNTGTWLKRFTRTPALLGLLPPVYYPSFQLNYFRVSADPESGAGVLFEYETVEKTAPKELTLLQRLLIRTPKTQQTIPARTVVGSSAESESERTRSSAPNTD